MSRRSVAALITVLFTLVVAATATATAAEAPGAPSTPPPPPSSTTSTLDPNIAAALAVEQAIAAIPTTTTTVAPASRPAPVSASANTTSTDGSRWDLLAQCETGGDWSTNTGNGFGGGLQFMHGPGYSTWLSFGGGEFAPNPWDATREEQIVVAERVLASSGWGAWPGCSRKFGWL